MKISTVLLTLAIVIGINAAPTEKLWPRGTKSGKVQFFSDDKCHHKLGKEIQIHPNPAAIQDMSKHSIDYKPGPAGAQSGWYTDMGDLSLMGFQQGGSQTGVQNSRECATLGVPGVFTAGGA